VGPIFHVDHVERHAKAHGFDPLFVTALVRVESSFARSARSPRGAVGLMQIMPETGYDMARRLGLKAEEVNLEDPDTNIRLGVYYLSVLRSEFGDDRVALLAAYNAGPKNAREWRKAGPLTVETIPFPETRALIERVNRTEARLRWIAGRARG
jgi:soluble lytic murein transglycosylase